MVLLKPVVQVLGMVAYQGIVTEIGCIGMQSLWGIIQLFKLSIRESLVAYELPKSWVSEGYEWNVTPRCWSWLLRTHASRKPFWFRSFRSCYNSHGKLEFSTFIKKAIHVQTS